MTDVQVDMSNIKSLVILLCVVGLGVYVFLELRKMKATIATLESQIQTQSQARNLRPPPPPVNMTPGGPVSARQERQERQERPSIPVRSPPNPSPEVVSVVKQVSEQKTESQTVPVTNTSKTIPISSNTIETGDKESSESDAYESDEDKSPPVSQEQPMTSNLFMDAPEPIPNEPSAGMSLNITELDRLMMDSDISPETDPVVPDIVEAEIPDISSLPGPPTDSQPQDIQKDTQKDKYKDKTVSELKEILEEKGLPTSGNKTKMIERIVSSESTP